ncbi:MAG: hypothetical protein MZV65_29065 [Chromatiales bacterium]|nr:hypothetical protein [Chromatiales bacterium]
MLTQVVATDHVDLSLNAGGNRHFRFLNAGVSKIWMDGRRGFSGRPWQPRTTRRRPSPSTTRVRSSGRSTTTARDTGGSADDKIWVVMSEPIDPTNVRDLQHRDGVQHQRRRRRVSLSPVASGIVASANPLPTSPG